MSTAPRVVKAAEFKAKCLELMDRVAESGEPIVITKRGKPVATLSPLRPTPKSEAGFYRGKMRVVGDIVEPIEFDWGSADPLATTKRRRR